MPLPLVATTSTVPWWWVAALAGAFTLLGGLLAASSSWLVARRKNQMDDYRRFEPDVIAIYVELDGYVDVIHNNAGGDPDEESRNYWQTYRATIRAVTRLELITSRSVYQVGRRFQELMFHFAPSSSHADAPMAELIETADELRLAVRQALRIPA